MKLSTQPYKGARDFYPEQKRQLNSIFEVWRKLCQRYGYEEYDAPIIEPLELYAAKSGEELVNEQSYRFTDRGGREVALRPEMTPTVARLVAGKRQELALPLRWFSIPSCWRYERPQKGRGREFYQLNVDIFGVESFEAEVEMLQMVDSLMSTFGAKEDMYEIKFNSRVLMDYILKTWLGLNEVEAKTIGKLIDRMHKMPNPEFIALIETSIPPTLREQGAADKLLDILNVTSLADLPSDVKEIPAVANLQKIVKAINGQGIGNFKFDPTLMRGLDYYTDFVFEVFDTNPDNNRSLFGGGRYDGLVGLFGVDNLPTIGFAISDVILLEFLKGHDLLPRPVTETELYVIPIGDVYAQVIALTQELREMGVNVALDITDRKTDKQLKAAVKKTVPYVLFVGEQELKNEQYKLKHLASGSEETHSLQRVVSIVKDRRQL